MRSNTVERDTASATGNQKNKTAYGAKFIKDSSSKTLMKSSYIETTPG